MASQLNIVRDNRQMRGSHFTTNHNALLPQGDSSFGRGYTSNYTDRAIRGVGGTGGSLGGGAGASGLGAAGGGTDAFGNLLSETQAGYDAANAANEARYGEVKSLYGDELSGIDAALAGMGQTERSQLNDRYANAEANALQSATGRGLAGTSVRGDINRGFTKDKQLANTALDESLAMRRYQMRQPLVSQYGSFIERREDMLPDMDRLERLAGELGQGSLAQGGASSYGGGGYGGAGGVINNSNFEKMSLNPKKKPKTPAEQAAADEKALAKAAEKKKKAAENKQRNVDWQTRRDAYTTNNRARKLLAPPSSGIGKSGTSSGERQLGYNIF